MQIVISVLITLSTLTASPDNRSQNACLGNYELHFSESSGNKICTHGGFLRVTLCKFGLVLHVILCCNVIEAVLLFFCFKAIQEQTEKSLHMIGEKSYTRRKRYFKKYIFLCSPPRSQIGELKKQYSAEFQPEDRRLSWGMVLLFDSLFSTHSQFFLSIFSQQF